MSVQSIGFAFMLWYNGSGVLGMWTSPSSLSFVTILVVVLS